MGDVLGEHESTDEMLYGPGLAAVRTQYKRIQSLLPEIVCTFNEFIFMYVDS